MAFHYCFTTCNNSFKLKVASFKPPKNVVITLIFFRSGRIFLSIWASQKPIEVIAPSITLAIPVATDVFHVNYMNGACLLFDGSLSLSLSLSLSGIQGQTQTNWRSSRGSIPSGRGGGVCVCECVYASTKPFIYFPNPGKSILQQSSRLNIEKPWVAFDFIKFHRPLCSFWLEAGSPRFT